MGLATWQSAMRGARRQQAKIVLTSTRKELKLPAGTGLLLRVDGPE